MWTKVLTRPFSTEVALCISVIGKPLLCGTH